MKAGKAPSEKIISCERNHKYCIGTCNNALYLCMTLHSNLVILYPICQSNIIAIIHHQVLVAVLRLQQPSQASNTKPIPPQYLVWRNRNTLSAKANARKHEYCTACHTWSNRWILIYLKASWYFSSCTWSKSRLESWTSASTARLSFETLEQE